MAAPPDNRKSPERKDVRAEEKRRFARAIAKAELGRHYWNERSEQALREALKRKPKK
jgi:hypothetical protein